MRWIIIFVLFILAACTSNPQVTERRNEIRVYESQLRSDPHNPELHFTLGGLFLLLAEESNDPARVSRAIRHYWRVLDVVPDHMPTLTILYRIHTSKAIRQSADAMDTVKTLYEKIPEDNRRELMAPSLVEYIQQVIAQSISGKENRNHLRSLLVKAISEQPDDPNVYIFLSDMHKKDGRHPLSIAVLEQGLERIDNSPRLHAKSAEVHKYILNQQDCRYINPSDWLKVVNHLQEAVRLDPDNVDYREDLALALRYIGQNSLALNQNLMAYELEPSAYLIMDISQGYLILGDRESSVQWLNRLTEEQRNRHYYIYRELALFHHNWQEALALYDEDVRNRNEITTYRFMYADIARLEMGVQTDWQDMQLEPDSDWYHNLFSFWRDQLDSVSLMESAQNTCQRTEGYFFTGYRKYREGDYQAARELFEAAVQETAYGYMEYTLAKSFLHAMDTP